MKKVSQTEFASVISNTKVVVVDVYADWCQPCKALGPVLEKIAGKLPDNVQIVKVDGEVEVGLVTQLNVSALPTLLFYKDGTLQTTLLGYKSEKVIIDTINSLL